MLYKVVVGRVSTKQRLLGNEEIIVLLLKNGANKMIEKNDGKTAYDIALEKGHEHLLHYLHQEVNI